LNETFGNSPMLERFINLKSVENSIESFFDNGSWVSIAVEAVAILVATAIINFLIDVIFKRIRIFLNNNNAKKEGFNWYIEIIKTVKLPIKKSLWVYSIALIVEYLCEGIKFPLTLLINNTAVVIIILIFGRAILRAINRVEDELLRSNGKDDNLVAVDRVTVDIVSKLFKAIVYVVGSLALMNAIGINISSILALGGISGLAIGFASKDLLSNFFGTIMIYLDKPFIIGENVRIDGKADNTGVVEKVDWRMTTIRTGEKKRLFIPNSIFSTATIENISRISHRVFQEDIMISYNNYDKILECLSNIKDLLKKNNEIDKKESVNIDIVEIYKDLAKIRIKFFCKITNLEKFSEFKNTILIVIAFNIKKMGLELALASCKKDII